MMMFRKISAVLMTALLLCSLCSCGSKTVEEASASVDETALTESAAAESASSETAESENAAGTAAAEEDNLAPESEWLSMPCTLEDGKLTINSLFSADLPNPDCGNADGEDLAAIEIVNNSDQRLAYAEIDMVAADGSQLEFIITGLPAGETMWAFDTSNTSLQEFSCVSVTDSAEFDTYTLPDDISVSVEGTTITLTNNSGSAMNGLQVLCHTVFDDVLFGGTAYTYTVDALGAGESTVIDAYDCWLGQAEVVYLAADG